MLRSAIGSLVCASAADAVPTNSAVMSKRRMIRPPYRGICYCALSRKRREGTAITALVSQAFGCEPLLDQVGDLIAVLVHHHHVGIALDADVGQIDHIDAAAGRLEHARIVDATLADLRPARMTFGIVAVNDHHRRRL